MSHSNETKDKLNSFDENRKEESGYDSNNSSRDDEDNVEETDEYLNLEQLLNEFLEKLAGHIDKEHSKDTFALSMQKLDEHILQKQLLLLKKRIFSKSKVYNNFVGVLKFTTAKLKCFYINKQDTEFQFEKNIQFRNVRKQIWRYFQQHLNSNHPVTVHNNVVYNCDFMKYIPDEYKSRFRKESFFGTVGQYGWSFSIYSFKTEDETLFYLSITTMYGDMSENSQIEDDSDDVYYIDSYIKDIKNTSSHFSDDFYEKEKILRIEEISKKHIRSVRESNMYLIASNMNVFYTFEDAKNYHMNHSMGIRIELKRIEDDISDI